MKNKSKEKNKLNSQQAITLIALVVTIVVLLILAGVSLNLVLGNNGIINKAQQAKVETRAGSVDDEVNLWKTDNYLADNTNSAAETDSQMIARLRKNNLITADDEVDTENKTIKIKKKDGTVVREISYAYTSNKTTKNIFNYTPEGIITGIKDEFITNTNPDNPEQARTNKSVRLANLNNQIKIASSTPEYYLVKELNGTITIPETIEGTKIVGIGEGAFAYILNLQNVTINAQIVSIGNSAFAWCSALSNINIPNSVEIIGNFAFEKCNNLTSISIKNGVKTIGDKAFRFCYNLTSITIENGIVTIGDEAFYNTGLTEITIPSSVVNMGSEVFYNCADELVVIVPFKEKEQPSTWNNNWNTKNYENETITVNYKN